MFCPACGTKIEGVATVCSHCGATLPVVTPPATTIPAPPSPTPPIERIPNYLVWAILATICCCLPGGIVAIVYAAQVNGKIALGDLVQARRYSRLALIWCWVSFGVGIVVGILYVFIVAASSMLGSIGS